MASWEEERRFLCDSGEFNCDYVGITCIGFFHIFFSEAILHHVAVFDLQNRAEWPSCFSILVVTTHFTGNVLFVSTHGVSFN